MARTSRFQKFIRLLQTANRQNLHAEGKPLPLTKAQLTKEQFRWTRRRFIKSAALASGGAIAATTLSRLETAWGTEDREDGPSNREGGPRIAIVGGGIAGLNAAYQLKKVGLNATIYEAKNRVGGRIQSATNLVGEGLVTDLGGSLINTDHEDILALVSEFSLRLFNRVEDAEQFPFPAVGYFFEGRTRSESEVADKLRPLAAQISRDADLLDQDFDRFLAVFDRQSVTQYLNTHADKIPEPFIRVLVENTIRTEYGVEPEESSAMQLIFNLPTVDGKKVEILGNSDEVFMVEGGSGQIIASLANALSEQIYTQRRLTRIQNREPGFRLTFDNYSTVDADYVIIAIPFTVLRDVDIRINLPRNLRRFINEARLGLNEKLFAGFNQKTWRQDNGFVQEIWTDLGFSEAWEETQRQTNRQDGALTFYLGGNQVKVAQRSSTRDLGRQFVARLNTAVPGVQGVANNRFSQTQWTKDPFLKGAYSTFSPGQLTTFGEFLYIESDDPAERQDVNVGNLIFAGEHLSDAFYGFMNGAAETGRLAANVITRKLRGDQTETEAQPKLNWLK